MHGSVALLVGSSIVFMLANIAQRTASEPLAAQIGLRIQYACVAVTPTLLTHTILHLLHRQTTQRIARAMALASILFVLLVLATPFVIGRDVVVRRAIDGPDYLDPVVGPLYVPFVLGQTAMALVALRVLRSFPIQSWSARPVVLSVFGATLVLGMNDALSALGVISTGPLYPYASVALVLCVSFVANRQVVDRFANLEDAVLARTKALAQNEVELRDALERIRVSEVRFRSLSDATSEGVLFHTKGRISDANRAAGHIFGCEPIALVERDVGSLFVPDPATSEVVVGENVTTLVGVKVDGETFPVEATSRDLDPESEILTVRDVSEQKLLQTRILLADRLASLGTLAAGAAHEINNPLTYVLGGIETLEGELESGGDSNPKMHAWRSLLREMRFGCVRVAHIVRELRELALGQEEERTVIRIEDAIETAIRMTLNETSARAKIVRDYEGDPSVSANPERLGQVLVNLLVNAAQSIPPGAATRHEITLRVRPLPGARVRVEVSDTGMGIPSRLLPRIFDPFVTSKPVGQGMGLGLSICHNIIASLGGTISVESVEGKGTTFRIELPAETSPPTERSVVRPSTPPKGPSLRVLVVDDEPMVGRAIQRMLKDHEAIVAEGGKLGLALAREGTFDLVLCDLMMPEVSGMDLYEALAASRPEVAERIVFITGGAHTESARAFLEGVPNRKLNKPIELEAMRNVVGWAAEKKRSS